MSCKTETERVFLFFSFFSRASTWARHRQFVGILIGSSHRLLLLRSVGVITLPLVFQPPFEDRSKKDGIEVRVTQLRDIEVHH